MEHSPQEMELLQLLKELQEILANAVNSLGGQTPKSPEAHYMGFVAKSVNTAADGYLVLRQAFRVNASKLLIRPALEITLAGAAVERTNGGFLCAKLILSGRIGKKCSRIQRASHNMSRNGMNF